MVQTAPLQQFFVVSFFHGTAILKHDDLVGLFDRGQSMRDCDGGAVLGYSVERLLNNSLSADINRAGRLVEDQNRGLRDNAAGDGKSLALASTQLDSILADNRIVALPANMSAHRIQTKPNQTLRRG